MTTPVRAALLKTSMLQQSIKNGLGAVAAAHHGCLDQAVRPSFVDSLDLDKALLAGHAQANRWDYLLGHGPSRQIVAVEPHAAKQDEITTVIKKRTAARDQLRAHLLPGAQIAKWLWVASGTVQFANTDKARLKLAQNGIEFVDRRVQARHLPAAAPNRSARHRG